MTGCGLDDMQRALRLTKHIGLAPVEAICLECNRVFKVPLTLLSRSKDAITSLQQQFDRHECKREDTAPTSQARAERGLL